VEKYTQIPTPRAIDVIKYSDSSYLLMTGLPGKGVGTMLSTMTDKQVDAVVRDLKAYVAELRQILNKIDSGYQICNALGAGILDWRIGDSQRKELKFRDEAEFNQYLTHDLPLDKDMWKQISTSHDVKHDIVFTHADLNMRNILVDEDMKISGIVDWECAGWYPEYWEYTKAHFSARYTTRWIVDVLDQVFLQYRDELQVEDMFASLAPSW
jgi:aminoglycoside phosphotransferase